MITPPSFEMTANWDLKHVLGYLDTWSSAQCYQADARRTRSTGSGRTSRPHGAIPIASVLSFGPSTCGLEDSPTGDVCDHGHAFSANPLLGTGGSE